MPDQEVLEADTGWLAAKIIASLNAQPLALDAPVMDPPQDVEVDVSGDRSRYLSPGSRGVVRGLAYRTSTQFQGSQNWRFVGRAHAPSIRRERALKVDTSSTTTSIQATTMPQNSNSATMTTCRT